MKGFALIRHKLSLFKKRYYLNIAIRGLLLSASLLLLYFILAILLENAFWLNTASRFTLLAIFVVLAFICIYLFLRKPLEFWLSHKGLSDEETATYLGNRLPVVKDRLLNMIQLGKQAEASELAYASIEKKSSEFASVAFETAVPRSENKRYARYALVPVGILLLLLLINARLVTDSTHRIIHFEEQFSPQAPFDFQVQNSSLTAFRNEDFNLEVTLKGDAVPDEAYLISGSRRMKLASREQGKFTYTFSNLQHSCEFQIEAAGFFSTPYTITVADRPELADFKILLEFPSYIHRKAETLVNTGNIQIPEGTTASWEIEASHTEKADIRFNSDSLRVPFQSTDNQLFKYSRRFINPDQYEISLSNAFSMNKDRILYSVEVIKDAYPQINLNSYRDSVFYRTLALGGAVSDDYGLTRLAVFYRIADEGGHDLHQGNFNLPLFPNQQEQSFFYAWSIDSLGLKPGQRLDYYLEVWDNDGVNGRKSTKTSSQSFEIPARDELVTQINQSSAQTTENVNSGIDKAKDLSEQLKDLTQNLKGKQNLDWQDKQKINDLLQQRKDLDNMIEGLQKQNDLLNEKKDAFTEQNERIKEKAEQIRKLLDQLLDDKTRQLLDQLQDLLKQNADDDKIRQMLDELSKNSDNLEKELERTYDLLKQEQYDFQLDQTINKLKDQIASQKELQKETEDLKSGAGKDKTADKESDKQSSSDSLGTSRPKTESEQLANDQEKLKNDFEKISQDLKDLKQMGQDIKQNSEDLPSEDDTQQVKDAQQQSQEMLQQNQPTNSSQSQQKALDKMQQMQQQMEDMQQSTAMEIDAQNLESLRHILHGLITLSFDQESMMNDFNTLQQNDPRFNRLAEQQMNLRDDSKVLEDSLLSLAKRDPFMSAFVTRKITDLNDHMDKSIDGYHERNRPQAATEMQATMTSINDLALMLDDHYNMLMQMIANAKPSNKKGQKGMSQNLSQLQQKLNDQIEQLKNSQKSGRELSEDLARMAAEQERIRKALEELQQQQQQRQGGPIPGNDLPSKMEESELDLVNKQLTDQLIQRQHQIMTRLLDAEKSLRQQDIDNKRQAETAKEDYDKVVPRAFEDYLKLKQKEVELLKTVPPKLYPFYKNEVNDYFNRINQ